MRHQRPNVVTGFLGPRITMSDAWLNWQTPDAAVWHEMFPAVEFALENRWAELGLKSGVGELSNLWRHRWDTPSLVYEFVAADVGIRSVQLIVGPRPARVSPDGR